MHWNLCMQWWYIYTCEVQVGHYGLNNGLAPDRSQAILWTNADLLSTGPLKTDMTEILIKIK